MFGGCVWGTRLGSDVPQTRHEQNTSPQHSIRRGLVGVLGVATGGALTTGLATFKITSQRMENEYASIYAYRKKF